MFVVLERLVANVSQQMLDKLIETRGKKLKNKKV